MRDLPPGARDSRDWFRPEGFTALRVLTAKNPTTNDISRTGITLYPNAIHCRFTFDSGNLSR